MQEAEVESQSTLRTTSELYCHAYARYLMYLLHATPEAQLKLRPYSFIRFLPPQNYRNARYPVSWEAERELAVFFYQNAPQVKLRWIFLMPARFVLEQLTEDEQWRMLVILKGYYGRP